LRDELAVHQDALILNYLGGGHFSGGGTAGARNGEKIFGPWYVYINAGATPDAIIADAKLTALEEEQKWPYPWVKEPVYPIKRTAVSGQLRVSHGRSAAYAYIILGQPDNMQGGRGGGRGGRTPPGVNNGQATDRASILYNQAGDYIFYVKADVDGKFTLPHVRPGTYTLYAWQTQGPITQSYAKDNIVVSGDKLDLGVLDWDPPYHPNLIWQIGKADRLAGEFKYGNVPRYAEWIKQVPANMTFTIGQSNDETDWYFAQPTGTWTVKFNVDKVPSGNGYLTIAIAGGGGSVTAALNGTTVGQLAYGDDGSVRRSTNRSGRYARNEYTFPASDLKQGENTLTLQTVSGGLMYDTIVMESD
jgi:rhamnogalacturonan endolyase